MKTKEGSKFNNPDFYRLINKYHDASYLRWNRLTNKQTKQFEDYGLLPDMLNHALKIFHILKTHHNTESVPFSINLTELTYDLYNTWCVTEPNLPRLKMSESRAIREVIFRGFVKLGTFKVKPQRSYVMTKKMEDGNFYIHPFQMGSNYNMTVERRQLPYLWDTAQKIGIPGYCQVIYPEMDHYPSLKPSQINQIKIDWGIA